jgi:hypothetical protein
MTQAKSFVSEVMFIIVKQACILEGDLLRLLIIESTFHAFPLQHTAGRKQSPEAVWENGRLNRRSLGPCDPPTRNHSPRRCLTWFFWNIG